MSKEPFYVTTPIYYVNGVPHIGTAYTTIAADTVARWQRMDNHDVWFLTGMDEHGQKVAQSAQEHDMTPQEWCDSQVPQFTDLWKELNISNNDFIRTTQERHTRGVQQFMQDLYDKGYLYKSTYQGYYCTPCETQWAKSDLTEDGKCPTCGRDVDFIEEENWFFKLSEFGDKLLAYYDEHPKFIRPKIRENEIRSFIESGMHDLSVSRTTFDWGVPLPFDSKHVTYVWVDALINYITALGYGSDDLSKYNEFWPANFHFVGKDIIRFHCVIWPAMLMAAGLPIPEHVFAHGFLMAADGSKMSKSKGNALYPRELIDRYGDPPPSVSDLVNVSLVRVQATAVGVYEVTQKKDTIVLNLEHLDVPMIRGLLVAFNGRVTAGAGNRPYLSVTLQPDEKPLELLQSILKAMAEILASAEQK